MKKNQHDPACEAAAQDGPSRREFLKWCAALGGACMLPGLPPGLRQASAAVPARAAAGETMFYSGCTVNCGSQCFLRVFVKDGHMVRVESDDSDDSPSSRANRACLRGRSMRQYTYSPDRIKTPLRRIAGTRRGEGKFEAISWEEAIQTIAREWVRVLDQYGPEAVYRKYGSGTTSSAMNRRDEWFRLANLMGGYLNEYGTYSTAQIAATIPYLYGTNAGNSIYDMENSKLIVMFGSNILETRASGGGLSYELLKARRRGNARLIIVDPRYSDSMAKLGDEWVPIRPGSDGALTAAIAYVLITENLADREFLDKYCVGFDEAHMPEGVPPGSSYKDYILGNGPDKTPKTPQWAAAITGYPADKTVRLAREIGMAKPCCIIQGYGPQRHACGDTSARAIAALAVLTGNVGISGGNSGSSESIMGINFEYFPTGKNPVTTAISFFTWPEAVTNPEKVTATKMGLRGREKLNVGIKFLWNSVGNSLINQHSDINATKKVLEDDTKCEFIVVTETRMTSSAMFADIILPSVTPPEQDDFIKQGYQVDQGTLLIARKAIEPLFESRTQYDICVDLAREMGKLTNRPDLEQQYTEGRTQLDWVKYLYEKAREIKPELPASFDEASAAGTFRWFPSARKIAFKPFRDDPEANPLKTPSGKIELFSKRLWDLNNAWELPEGEAIHALPAYEKTWEGPDDHEGMKTYPLQLIGHHYKGRTHSTFANLPWLMQVAPQQLWINPLDAARRGIQHGDMVRVYNDRGVVVVPAKVTPRIMPGVLSLPQGAWYRPDRNGTDLGGCINTLTKTHMTPLSKGNPQHTNLVEVAKA